MTRTLVQTRNDIAQLECEGFLVLLFIRSVMILKPGLQYHRGNNLLRAHHQVQKSSGCRALQTLPSDGHVSRHRLPKLWEGPYKEFIAAMCNQVLQEQFVAAVRPHVLLQDIQMLQILEPIQEQNVETIVCWYLQWLLLRLVNSYLISKTVTTGVNLDITDLVNQQFLERMMKESTVLSNPR